MSTEAGELHEDHQGQIVAAVGECKGGQETFTRDDLSKLRQVADAVRASGIECFLLFSTTRERLTREERAIFSEYNEGVQNEPPVANDHMNWRRPAPIIFT